MKNKNYDELLVITMEECAELSVECSKLIRFGSDSPSEVHKLEVEVGDLLCMIDLLEEYGLIDLKAVSEYREAKRQKLKKWSNLANL